VLIENDVSVAAPPDEVYALMLDVQRVAPCIPGAQVLGQRDDGSYDAQATVKLGPVTMTYRGTVAIADEDAAARSATLHAKGNEARGQGTAQATMHMRVDPDGAGSRVHVQSDLLVTGRVAQMGKGIMQDVASRMLAEMASCLATQLREPSEGDDAGASPGDSVPGAEPANAASLVGPALLRRIGPLLAAAAAFVLVVLLRRRARR
jgi:carbon monoxide dehydrogenase subunit G